MRVHEIAIVLADTEATRLMEMKIAALQKRIKEVEEAHVRTQNELFRTQEAFEAVNPVKIREALKRVIAAAADLNVDRDA